MMMYSIVEDSTLNETSEVHTDINERQTDIAASVKPTDYVTHNKQKFQIINLSHFEG